MPVLSNILTQDTIHTQKLITILIFQMCYDTEQFLTYHECRKTFPLMLYRSVPSFLRYFSWSYVSSVFLPSSEIRFLSYMLFVVFTPIVCTHILPMCVLASSQYFFCALCLSFCSRYAVTSAESFLATSYFGSSKWTRLSFVVRIQWAHNSGR